MAEAWRRAHPAGASAAWLGRVEVRVLTPGSESGAPVDVVTALTRAPAASTPRACASG